MKMGPRDDEGDNEGSVEEGVHGLPAFSPALSAFTLREGLLLAALVRTVCGIQALPTLVSHGAIARANQIPLCVRALPVIKSRAERTSLAVDLIQAITTNLVMASESATAFASTRSGVAIVVVIVIGPRLVSVVEFARAKVRDFRGREIVCRNRAAVLNVRVRDASKPHVRLAYVGLRNPEVAPAHLPCLHV